MRHSQETYNELIETMKSALGDVLGYIQAPNVTDIVYNSTSDKVFVDGKGEVDKNITFPPSDAQTFVKTVAAFHNIEINKNHSTISVQLPDELNNCRLQANVEPVVDGVSFALRKPGGLYPLTDYVDSEMRDLLRQFLIDEYNILIVGSTGSGKTSFLISLLDEMASLRPDESIRILEDTREIICSHENHDFLKTVKDRNNNVVQSMADNVANVLRLNPDRLVVGEIREEAPAKAVLQGWDTGHNGGFCTLHGNDAISGFQRFYRLGGLDEEKIGDMRKATSAVDASIYLEKIGDDRQVTQAVTISLDESKGKPQYETIYSSKN